MVEIRLRIQDAELVKLLKNPEIIRGPLNTFLKRSTLVVEGRAKEKAPVDTGRLANSIASDVRGTQGFVGSSVFYAPYVEFGTRPHWPPMAALQPWARRHGFQGRSGLFLLARAIARRGTRAQPYLIPALKESLDDIVGFLDDMGVNIGRLWAQGGPA